MTDRIVKAYLFDFSGVLRGKTHARGAIYAAIEARYGLTKSVLKAELARRNCLKPDPKSLAIELVTILSDLLGYDVDSSIFQEIPDVVFIPENLELVRHLRTRYKTAVVANSSGTVEDRLRRNGARDLFDSVIDSGIVGFAKPDPRIYLLAATELGCRPEECVFIDDKPDNVRGAEAVGMQALHYVEGSSDRLEQKLLNFGLLDLPRGNP